MKKLALILCALGFSTGAFASTPFESSVNQVYELSAQIRSLRSTKDPEYGSLIKDCRKTLYWSMNVLAESGEWDRLSDKIPDATVCSFTGKVLAATEFEWEDKFTEAEKIAKSKNSDIKAAPILKSPFAKNQEVQASPAPVHQEPPQKAPGSTMDVLKQMYLSQNPEFQKETSVPMSEILGRMEAFKKNLSWSMSGYFSSCKNSVKEFYMTQFTSESDAEAKEFVVDYACYKTIREQEEKSPDDDYLSKNMESAQIAFNLTGRGSRSDVSIEMASSVSGTDPKKIKEVVDALDFFVGVGREIYSKSE